MKLKKIALSGALLGLTLSSYAQETNMQSAMPLNENDLNGTARFRAMSGAFGAVGGDLSALKIKV